MQINADALSSVRVLFLPPKALTSCLVRFRYSTLRRMQAFNPIKRKRASRSLVKPVVCTSDHILNLPGLGILDTTRTSLGRFLLRQWLLRPCLSIPTITARHDAVECLLRPENLGISDSMRNHLKGFRNIPRILRIMKSGKAGLYDWQGLVKVNILNIGNEFY